MEKLKVKYTRLCARKVVKDSIYCEGRVNISSVLNKALHETLDLPPAIILTTFFCNQKTHTVCMVAPEHNSIFQY
jgi:hypothetical protein